MLKIFHYEARGQIAPPAPLSAALFERMLCILGALSSYFKTCIFHISENFFLLVFQHQVLFVWQVSK